MSNHFDDWTELQTVWREQPNDREMYNRYILQIMREKRRLQYEMGAEVLLSLISAAIFTWWAYEADAIRRMTFILLAVFSITVPIATFFMRRSLWRAQTDTFASHRIFLYRRARLGLTLARIGLVSGPVGIALGFFLAGTLGLRVTGTDDTMVLILAGAALTAMYYWSITEARKWRLTLKRLDAYREDGFDTND
jgi:hypothetical protein